MSYCYAHFGCHYMVGGNKVEDGYGGFDLSRHSDSSSLVVMVNMVGASGGCSLAVDIRGKTCGD